MYPSKEAAAIRRVVVLVPFLVALCEPLHIKEQDITCVGPAVLLPGRLARRILLSQGTHTEADLTDDEIIKLLRCTTSQNATVWMPQPTPLIHKVDLTSRTKQRPAGAGLRARRRITEVGVSEMDSTFLHLPKEALEHIPDGEIACQAMHNASVLRQMVASPTVQLPCPVRIRPLVEPSRVWPENILVAECACAGSTCRERSAAVCTQIYSPVVIIKQDEAKQLHQERMLIASGCRCLSALATISVQAEELDYV